MEQLNTYIMENTKQKIASPQEVRLAILAKEQERIENGFCPKCQTPEELDYAEGCAICYKCGWSAC